MIAQYWVSILLTAYGSTVLVGSPLFGYFADHYRSRRPPFVLGLLALVMSTCMLAAVISPAALVVARALQGLSAAAVWVVGLALIVDNVHESRIGQAMGSITLAMTMGGILGPMLGGLMYDLLGYHGTFVLPTVLIILDIVLRFSIIERSVAQRMQQDLPTKAKQPQMNSDHGEDLEAGGSCSRTGPGERSEESPHLSPSLAAGGSTTVSRDKASAFNLLRSARLLVALLTSFVASLNFTALETVWTHSFQFPLCLVLEIDFYVQTLPLFVMKTFHWSPSGAGLIFLSLSLPSVAGFYAGKSIDRFGARRPGQIAMSMSGLALFFLRFVQRESVADKALLSGSLAVVGLGITILQIIGMTEVFEVIGDSEAESPGIFGDRSPMAQGYALFNMAFAAGQLFGPLLAGFLRVHAGWNGMTLIFGIICALAVVPITIFSGTRCTATEGESGDEHVEAGSA
ncbi:hypothetical protein N7467_001335 [Penicillium canescens]|nr:hypothetical protein N7467_001335 [Penicillium canescens]